MESLKSRKALYFFLILLLCSGLLFTKNKRVGMVPQTTQSQDNATQSAVINQQSEVIQVLDGDTIIASISGKHESVRLIGIDAPETEKEGQESQCFSNESREEMKKLVGGQVVKLVSDPTQSDKDKYERLLRYIYLADETMVNRTMLSGGFAREYTYLGNSYQYQKEFIDAQKEAKEKNLGLWSACKQ